jgi:hypothetical protein
MTTFLFVGERPSNKAAQIGATWENGRLAAKQLHDALRALNIEPTTQEYVNLWTHPDAGDHDYADQTFALGVIQRAYERGLVIVGMGRIVCGVLMQEGIPHLQMVHPAARGAIRKKERYTAHVDSVLFSDRVALEQMRRQG